MKLTLIGLKFGTANRGRIKTVKNVHPSSRHQPEIHSDGQQCRQTVLNSSRLSTRRAHWARTAAMSTLFACLLILLETTIVIAKSVFHDLPGQILALLLSMNAPVVFMNAMKMLFVTTRRMVMDAFVTTISSETAFTAKE